MSLPETIEIVPTRVPVGCKVSVPGSKSITNRALILAALGDGRTVLRGALWSEDTQIMVDALRKLGFEVLVEPDPTQYSNRTITVTGLNGWVPLGGTPDAPLELFVGNAGTAARFLAAFVCLGKGVYKLVGTERMHQRPQKGLFNALRQLGYRVEPAPGDKLPALIYGGGPLATPTPCIVDITESSQFASALLLCANTGKWLVNVVGENPDESPYVAMTKAMIERFPKLGGEFVIEPDSSSGSYFWAAGIITHPEYINTWTSHSIEILAKHPEQVFPVVVEGWPFEFGWQIDSKFPMVLMRLFRPDIFGIDPQKNLVTISRKSDLGDSIMTAVVVASFAQQPTLFEDLGRLRLQECERVLALRTELSKCGVVVVESGDTLQIEPSLVHGAEIETYNDHRMAMCFSILGLRVANMRIRNPNCVRKTFPDFYQKLAAPPPLGLGVKILDGNTRSPIELDRLLAS